MYRTVNSQSNLDLNALSLKDHKPFSLANSPFDERDGQFSPDGKWVAYESDESGRYEIYVRPFPGLGPRSRISRSGGSQVRWRRNGMELFYIAPDGRLMAAPIHQASNPERIEADTPVALFTTVAGGPDQFSRQQYVASDDGQRFLVNVIRDVASSTAPITLLLNWRAVAERH
jgi:Tol biopolymer transport system component